MSSCVVDELIYVLGGFVGGQYLSSIEVFDPKINKWYSLNHQMSTSRSNFSTVVVQSNILSIGGLNNERKKKSIEATESYDTKTQQSTIIEPPLPNNLEGHNCCLMKGWIVVCCGVSKKVIVMNYKQQSNNNNIKEWITNSETQFDHFHGTMTVVGSTIFIFGGRESLFTESTTVISEEWKWSEHKYYPKKFHEIVKEMGITPAAPEHATVTTILMKGPPPSYEHVAAIS